MSETIEPGSHNVFTYVENWNTPAQMLCLDSLRRFTPHATILDPDSFSQIADEEVLSAVKNLTPTGRSDVIRVWLLLKFGGLWVDADCIHMRPIRWEGDLRKPGLCMASNRPDSIANTVLYSPGPANSTYSHYYAQQLRLVASGKHLSYLELGSDCIDAMHMRREFDVQGHWEYLYIDWHDAGRFWARKVDAEFLHDRHYWSANSYCHHLTGGVLWQVASLTREEVLGQQNLLGFLFRRAEGILPDAFGNRIQEILFRLPDPIGKYTFVEVGVLTGDTTTVVAQQRPNTQVIAVDPWRNTNSVEYHRTQDDCASMPDSAHQWNFEEFDRRSWFFKSRLEVRRQLSIDASQKSEDESCDLVFIDAEHSLKGVTSDIAAWWPKVRHGGWIGGHDYDASRWPGVVQAVDSWVSQHGVSQHELQLELGRDSTWWIRKPNPTHT